MEKSIEKICPKCNTVNPTEANFCRHCRHEFHPIQLIRMDEKSDSQNGDLQNKLTDLQRKLKDSQIREKYWQKQARVGEIKIEILESERHKVIINKVHSLIAILIMIIALLGLYVLMRNGETVQSWFQISYSSWQIVKISFLVVNWKLLVVGFLYFGYVIIFKDRY